MLLFILLVGSLISLVMTGVVFALVIDENRRHVTFRRVFWRRRERSIDADRRRTRPSDLLQAGAWRRPAARW
jgi:hypothetical protein